MAKIKELFCSAQKSDIEHFCSSTKDFVEEINELKSLLTYSEYDRALFLFYVELLSKAIKKPYDIDQFVSTVISYIDDNLNMKMSIIVLRCIRSLLTARFFIPVSFHLTKLMSVAMTIKNIKRVGKKFDYDSIKVTKEECESEELQMFIIKECILLIKKQCHLLGNSIGFPEYSTVICNELKTQCKVGIYKEITMDLIGWISKRRSYIEEERNKLTESTNMKKVEEFEKGLIKWENE